MSQNDFRAVIEKAIAAWEKAFNAKDAAAIANLYTEDASLLPPGSPLIKGRKNIQGFWQSFLSAGGSDAKLDVVEVEASGNTAYEIGRFNAMLPTGEGGTARGEGKYVVIWKRQSDGSVKLAVDIFNVNA